MENRIKGKLLGFNKKKMFKVSQNDSLKDKISRRLWREVRNRLSGNLYLLSFKSYWHYLFHKSNCTNECGQLYYTAQPNQGAGIGHQIANWLAGYHYAKLFDLKFAHLPFSTNSWDDFLGLGNNETKAKDLMKIGYKLVRLPIFHCGNDKEIDLNASIISSYGNCKIIFLASQDQFLRDLQIEIPCIKEKFFSAPARKNDKIIYDKNNFNIAIHVRRGDIMTNPDDPGLAMRYLCNDYYYKILKQVIGCLNTKKTIHIYFFSQGTPEDYPEFKEFNNMHWCLDMNAQQTFLHFVYADLLITSKSSFSYKPALINNGIKVCPRNFWHGYPDSKEWVLCENNGIINNMELLKLER